MERKRKRASEREGDLVRNTLNCQRVHKSNLVFIKVHRIDIVSCCVRCTAHTHTHTLMIHANEKDKEFSPLDLALWPKYNIVISIR